MKRHAILLAGLCFVLFSLSCRKTKNKINDATEFDMTYTSEVSVPSVSVSITAPAEFTSPDIPTFSSATFAAQNTAQDLIDEIKLTKFTITNKNAAGNLDFIKSITIFINADNLGDVVVANKTNVPTGVNSFSADMTGANIKEHLFKEKIRFKVKVTASTVPGADQKIKIDETVHVKGRKL